MDCANTFRSPRHILYNSIILTIVLSLQQTSCHLPFEPAFQVPFWVVPCPFVASIPAFPVVAVRVHWYIPVALIIFIIIRKSESLHYENNPIYRTVQAEHKREFIHEQQGESK
eukprot:scaffold185046_cov36-Attheya_sp.AAC.1